MLRERGLGRAHRGLVSLVAGALIVAGCGNSDDAENAGTTRPSATPAPTASTAVAAQTSTTAVGTAPPTTSPATSPAPQATSGGPVPRPGVPGVTDDEIHFAAFGTATNNPTGTCMLDCYVDGIEAYFAYRNSEGGIDGRELVLSQVLDDALANNQQRALEIVASGDAFAAFSATLIASGWADVANAGIPLYGWGFHPAESTGHDNIFPNNAVICLSCTSRGNAYVGTVVGATKVAVLAYSSESSQQCGEANKTSIEMYSSETGQEVAYVNDDLAFGLPNGLAPEVSAMKEAGVDFVLACFELNGQKTLAQEMERQGMGNVPQLHSNTYQKSFVQEAGTLFEGDIVAVSFRPFEAGDENESLTAFRQWMEKSGSELTEPAMIGWINADTAYQGIVAAGPEFDQAKVVAATNAMTAYTAGGLINPIDWSRQHEAPTQDDPATHGSANECYSWVKIHDGDFELLGDSATPWFCWDNGNRDWAEPTPTNFD